MIALIPRLTFPSTTDSREQNRPLTETPAADSGLADLDVPPARMPGYDVALEELVTSLIPRPAFPVVSWPLNLQPIIVHFSFELSSGTVHFNPTLKKTIT